MTDGCWANMVLVWCHGDSQHAVLQGTAATQQLRRLSAA